MVNLAVVENLALVASFAIAGSVTLAIAVAWYGKHWYDKLLQWERRLAAQAGGSAKGVLLTSPARYTLPVPPVPSLANPPAAGQESMVKHLAGSGVSVTAIAKQVYGHANGRYIAKVRDILRQAPDNGNDGDDNGNDTTTEGNDGGR